MSQRPVYSSFNIPTVITHPSVRCLQWSDDGQLCLVTKSAIHILTPNHGINFSTPADIKSLIHDESDRPLGWYRTMIETTRTQTHSWPSITQGWGSLALGSLDISVRAVTCSPSGLTSRGRCVLAVLNSNMEVSLYAAGKNHLKGEWMNIQDVTAYLLDNPRLEQIDETSWILGIQPVWGIYPAPLVDASILALGTRAGAVKLFRYAYTQISFRDSIPLVKLCENWITHIAWSPWLLQNGSPGRCSLACTTGDGGVFLINISQKLQLRGGDGFLTTYELDDDFERSNDVVCSADKCLVTALEWIAPILVYSKPGVIHLWSWPSSPVQWHGGRVLAIQPQNFSIGSSAFSCVSGFSYVKEKDVLLVALLDGSLHAIHNILIDPSWVPTSSDDQLTSEALSQASRVFFAQTTSASVGYVDVNRINGSLKPSDFSYKHEARHECVLVTAPFWPLDSATILRAAQETLVQFDCAMRSTPLHHLRPLLLHLCSAGRFAEICPRLLEVMDQSPQDESPAVSAPPSSQAVGVELQRHLRESLATHLFGWNGLLSLRMRLSIADMCWRLCKDEQMRLDCGRVAHRQLTSISHRVLHILVRHFTAIVTALTPPDVPFVLRVVVQSRLAGSPVDLAHEAEALSSKVNGAIAIDPSKTGLHELCPACHTEVPLEDITQATCPSGHTWARCSVTSFILSTSMVRTCIGCSRKALLPVSQSSAADTNWLPPAARSWIVKELLEAVQRCLFCGNSFVGIV
ncbi:transcription factor IIIC subunit delta N-term-domain-containing protein [Boletus edulis]|nr:transcription factor IIIC subunit delta N-term-domain-containing protein [Boletus edulis]